MAKDHFVPRHYLRQFAIDGSTEMVNVATVCPYRFLGTKAIKGQCQEVDFEEGDKALGELLKTCENDLAPVLARVVKKEDFTVPELTALKWFAATLHVRTRKAAESYKVFPKRIYYEVIQNAIESGKLPPHPDGQWSEEMVHCAGVPGFMIQNVMPCALEMETLETKLLKATDGAFFITSDNPVSVLNQFYANVEPHQSFVGFSRSGFQSLLPISPKLCLIFYDAKIYKVGSPRHRLITISADDVEIVNALQIQTSENAVYFQSAALAGEIERLSRLYSPLRVPVQDGLQTYAGATSDEEIIHFRQLSVKLPRLWQFCRLRRRTNYGIGGRRNPMWTALIDELMDDFEANPSGGDVHTRIAKILADPNSLRNIPTR